MATFNAAGKAPGVYMQEEDVPGPIAGVSTGIVAIVGPAKSGPINAPVFVTNWTQFLETFGGNIYSPQVYAPIAVRGFFENGGAVCCFVRAGVARQAGLDVLDRSPSQRPVFTVKAKAEGLQGNEVGIAVTDGCLCGATAVSCSADVVELSKDRLTLSVGSTSDDAAQFVSGDIVLVTQGGISEEAEVAIVAAADKKIMLKAGLVKAFSADSGSSVSIRLADIQGKKRVRLDSAKGLEPGSYIKLSQAAGGGGLNEYAVVEAVDGNTAILGAALSPAFSLAAGAADIIVRSLEFSMEVSYGAKEPEIYKNLSVVPYHSHYYEKALADSALILVDPSDPPNPSLPPYNLPDYDYAPNTAKLRGGVDDDPGGLKVKDYEDAIDALQKVQVNIVCVPDATSFGMSDNYISILNYLINHCEKMADRFAVLDSCRGMSVDTVQKYREKINATSYAAFYYPWIDISHPDGLGRMKVPPSGHIAGVYARTDDLKGVHKAPGNELIKGCLGPSVILNDTEHGLLNEVSINAIMNVPGSGTTIMGARTLSNSTQWRYINVRRLLLYIEKSIQNATRFAVFQPNNPSLWASVKRQSSDFLNTVWRSGALFGATPDQAFKVKVDEELNPPSVRALGQLIIEIVLYPVTPAEFIVFRVIQEPGGPSVTE